MVRPASVPPKSGSRHPPRPRISGLRLPYPTPIRYWLVAGPDRGRSPRCTRLTRYTSTFGSPDLIASTREARQMSLSSRGRVGARPGAARARSRARRAKAHTHARPSTQTQLSLYYVLWRGPAHSRQRRHTLHLPALRLLVLATTAPAPMISGRTRQAAATGAHYDDPTSRLCSALPPAASPRASCIHVGWPTRG